MLNYRDLVSKGCIEISHRWCRGHKSSAYTGLGVCGSEFSRVVHHAVLITLSLGSNGQRQSFSRFMNSMENECDRSHESKVVIQSVYRSIAAIFGGKRCSCYTQIKFDALYMLAYLCTITENISRYIAIL